MGKCVTKLPNEINQSLPQNTIPIDRDFNKKIYDILKVKNITVAQNEPIEVSWDLTDVNYTPVSCWIGLIPHTIVNTDERTNENEMLDHFIVYKNKGQNTLTTSKVGIYNIKCFSSNNVAATHICTYHPNINVVKTASINSNITFHSAAKCLQLTDLLSSSLNEKELRTDFMKHMTKYNAQILSIDKIKQAETNNKIFENILNTKNNKNWQYLYHGTSFEGAKRIIVNGFNREYNAHTHTGYGTYLSNDASIASQHCTRYNAETAVYCMLVCKTLIGDSVQGYDGMKQIALTKDDGIRYDSIVDDINNPSVFVINKDYHSIPMYLITFEYLSDERPNLLIDTCSNLNSTVPQKHHKETERSSAIPFDLLKMYNESVHKGIRDNFMQSMKHYDAQIIEVYEIKNSTENESILSSIIDSHKNTKCVWLYHGTSFENLKGIIVNGFNRDYNKRSKYGYGTYASSQAIIASQYCVRYNKSTPMYCMFVCKALIGTAMKGYEHIPKSKMISNDGYTQIDLLVDKLTRPQIYVIKRDYHCIPTHLVMFKYLSDKRKKIK